MKEKEEYKEEILELLEGINEDLEKLDWTKDVAPLAKEDKWGEKNWVARIMNAKGMLQNIQIDLRDLMGIEEEELDEKYSE